MTAFAIVPLAMFDIGFGRLSRSAQVLEFYLRTGPDRASEGLFRFRIGAVATDLGMSVEEIEEAARELEAERPFEFDRLNGLVLDTTALRHNPLKMGQDKNGNPRPDKRLTGALSKLKGLPIEAEPMIARLVHLADTWSPDFAFEIRKEWPDILPREAPLRVIKGLEGAEGASREELKRVATRRGAKSGSSW